MLFNSNTTQAWAWLSALEYYLIAFGITYTATDIDNKVAAYQYAVVLMIGNAAKWMDRLEVQGHAPNSFPEFEKLFIN